MRLHRPTIAVGIVLAIVVGAEFAIYRMRGESSSEPDRRAVAFVDGLPITAGDLAVRLDEMIPMASYHGHVAGDRAIALKRAALDDLVLDELIYREAVAAGQHARTDEIDRELAAVMARFDDAEAFRAALDETGISERHLRTRLARAIVVRSARAAHARQAVTESDIAAYYRDNAAMFQRPERVRLLEILLRVDPAEPSSAPDVERKARAILARVRRGEDFGAIARASSEDEYRVKDGDMGFVHRGRLDADFEAAVFAATAGRFEIARSLYGFEVFKVLEREPPAQLGLDEARPIIAERLERTRREQALAAWHARLRAGARIEISDPVLRDARPAQLEMAQAAVDGRPRPAPRGSHR